MVNEQDQYDKLEYKIDNCCCFSRDDYHISDNLSFLKLDVFRDLTILQLCTSVEIQVTKASVLLAAN